VDQLALAFTPPGIGRNQPSEAIDPIEGLRARLITTNAGIFERFCDLELARGRVVSDLSDRGRGGRLNGDRPESANHLLRPRRELYGVHTETTLEEQRQPR
jgi:hypothetical protein